MPFFWLCLPETKDLSLEEIGALFGDAVAIDFTHMTSEERATWDKNFLEGDMGSKDASQVVQLQHIERSTVKAEGMA